MPRDEFSKQTVLTIAQRAGYICSNPDCRCFTSGPHSNHEKSVILGEACHIAAASLNGPRFDDTHSPDERKGINNAIWLCRNCSGLIDKDTKANTTRQLVQMKKEHEAWVSAQGMVPTIPAITLNTFNGLRMTDKIDNINPELFTLLRENELVILNPNRIQFFNFHLAIYLPEAIIGYGAHTKNVGTKIEAKPVRPSWTVVNPGSGSVSKGKNTPTPNHTLDISILSAKEEVRIAFYSIAYFTEISLHPIDGSSPTIAENPDDIDFGNSLRWFIEGTYQYTLRGEYVEAYILVPLQYQFASRTITSLPSQQIQEPWDLAAASIYPGVTITG